MISTEAVSTDAASQDLRSGLLRGRIAKSALVRLWKSTFGIDVDRFLPSNELQLKPVPPHNYYRFTPALSGDADFYSTLMRRMGYESGDRAEFIAAASHIGPRDSVLDVGCGTGNFSRRCSGTYRGIDTNPTAIEDGQKLGRNIHLGFVQDEKPGAFDVTVAFQVLEHVDDPRGFIDACVATLRPGGRLIISTPNMDSFMGYVANGPLNYPPHHMTWWSESSMRALVEDCGCRVTAVWFEPLRRLHIYSFLSALISPRNEGHIDSSLRFRIVDFGVKVISKLASRKWEEVPFATGHTVMVIAEKKSQ